MAKRIYWRNNPQEQLRIYELNTATFGLTTPSFLVIRSLWEIVNLNEVEFRKETFVIKHGFCLNDLLTEGNTQEEVEKLKENITGILKQAWFIFRKWKNNGV